MKKNVASQSVGCQLVSKTDGSAITSGTTTVYVTGDAGTQATGSVGSGAATHEGNGYWTYNPSQGETNYDLVAFTFVNTSAINSTVQIYTSFPQTGDNYARLGAPSGASVSADIATVAGYIDTEVSAIKTKTDFLPSATAGAAGGLFIAGSNAATTVNFTGNLSGSVGSVTGAVGSVTGNVGGNVTGSVGSVTTVTSIVNGVWDEAISGHLTSGTTGAKLNSAASAGDPWSTSLPGSYTSGQAGYILGTNLNATVSSRATQTSVDTIDDFVDTEVSAIKTKTDQLTFTTANRVDAQVFGIQNNAITAASIATDAIDSDAIAASAVTEIQSGLSTFNAASDTVTVGTNNDKTGYALTSAYDFAKGTAAMTESYAANGAAPTPIQAMYAIHQMLMQFSIATTSYTVKKLDNTTTAFVVTLNDATNPTSAVRT